MIGTQRVLAVVPARGGSKRIPRKNLQIVGGRPLLEWTVRAARASASVDHLLLTSESEEILALARTLGFDTALRRPDALAGDDVPGIDPVLHALESAGNFDIVVLLQPTSPLRRPEDIDACVAKCAANAPACVSVTPCRERPEWMIRIGDGGRVTPLFPGMEGGTPHIYNGAVYAARVPWLRSTREFIAPQTVAHVMPQEFSIDIDTPLDLRIADLMLAGRSTRDAA